MILSTLNFEYALQYDMFSLCEASNAFIDAFCYWKYIFISQDRSNRLKQC